MKTPRLKKTMKTNSLKIINLKLSELKPYANNARIHDEQQVKQIVNSIKEFGWTNPILIDENNNIIAGHGRIMAAKILKLESVPCIPIKDLTEAQIKALVIADNQLALNANWHEDILKVELEALKDFDFNIDLLGFDDKFLNSLLEPEIVEGLTDEDAVPEMPEEPKTKLGDIYQLGNHRLMCGDSTSIDAVEKLMDGKKADMVFTDPPYGINEETDSNFASRTRLAKGNTFSKIIGDDSIQTALDILPLIDSISIQVLWGANYYCHSLPQTNNWLVWDKREEEKERDMNSDCELAYVKCKKSSIRIFRHKWKGMIKASEHGQARIHPTQKPIALAEWCFNEYGNECKSILDLFGGSGSTLIACEKTNRNCYMMELEPHYCDVIVKRWEDFTGKKAVLLGEQ